MFKYFDATRILGVQKISDDKGNSKENKKYMLDSTKGKPGPKCKSNCVGKLEYFKVTTSVQCNYYIYLFNHLNNIFFRQEQQTKGALQETR